MKTSHFSSNYDFSSRPSGATSSTATIYHDRSAHHFHENLNCDSDVTITSTYPNSSATSSGNNNNNNRLATHHHQNDYHNNLSIRLTSNSHLGQQPIKYEPLSGDSVDAEQTEQSDEYHVIRSTNKYHHQQQQQQQQSQSSQKGTSSKRKRESG